MIQLSLKKCHNDTSCLLSRTSNMKNKFTLITMLCFFLFGCGDDKYADYIGLWQMSDTSYPKVAKISKDGETYLLNENVLQEKDFFGHKKKSMVLKQSENQLSIENGLGSITLGISADGKTLHIANHEYTKIDEKKLNEIQSAIEKEKLEKEKNQGLCKALDEQYQQEKNTIMAGKYSFSEQRTKITELSKKLKEQSKSIPNCTLFFW